MLFVNGGKKSTCISSHIVQKDDLSVLTISKHTNKSLAQVFSDFRKYICESAW